MLPCYTKSIVLYQGTAPTLGIHILNDQVFHIYTGPGRLSLQRWAFFSIFSSHLAVYPGKYNILLVTFGTKKKAVFFVF